MDSLINNVFVCKHCGANFTDFDAVPTHRCFLGKDVFMDNDNVLYYTPEVIPEDEEPNYNLENVSEDATSPVKPSTCSQGVSLKQPAVWSKEATLALLSQYSVNKGIITNPKKQGKLWIIISDGLSESFGIEMSKDQVRWKINALIQKYHDCIDNNSKSGRGVIDFEYFEEMEEILHKQRDGVAGCTVGSKFTFLKRKADASGEKASRKESRSDPKNKHNRENHSDELLKSSVPVSSCKKSLPQLKSTDKKSTLTSSPPACSSSESRVRKAHGTGSNVAKAKLELEKQWLSHLANKEKRDDIRDARHDKMFEKKKEAIKLKKQQLAIKEKECEARKQVADNKLEQQARRHAEILDLEKLKCKLLNKYLESKVNRTPSASSDSDG